MAKKKHNKRDDLYDMSVQEELLKTLKEFNDSQEIEPELNTAEKIIKKVTSKQQISGKELKFDGSEEPEVTEEFKEIDKEYDKYFSFLKRLRAFNLVGIILTVLYSIFFIGLLISLGMNNFGFNPNLNFSAYALALFFVVGIIFFYSSIFIIFLVALNSFDFSEVSKLENKLIMRLSIVLVILLGFVPFVNMLISIFPRVFLKPYSQYRQNEYDHLNLWYQESIASLFDEDDVERLFNKDTTIIAKPEEVYRPTNPISISKRIDINDRPAQIKPNINNRPNEYWRNRPIFNISWVRQNNLFPSIILSNMQKIIEALRKENREMQEFIKNNLFRRTPPPALPSNKPKKPKVVSAPKPPVEEIDAPLIIENKGKIKIRLVDDTLKKEEK